MANVSRERANRNKAVKVEPLIRVVIATGARG